MKNIAYKIAQNCKSLPDGFIIEYYPTDKDFINGYTVVDAQDFKDILSNANVLFQNFVNNKINEEINVRNTLQQKMQQEIFRQLRDGYS